MVLQQKEIKARIGPSVKRLCTYMTVMQHMHGNTPYSLIIGPIQLFISFYQRAMAQPYTSAYLQKCLRLMRVSKLTRLRCLTLFIIMRFYYFCLADIDSRLLPRVITFWDLCYKTRLMLLRHYIDAWTVSLIIWLLLGSPMLMDSHPSQQHTVANLIKPLRS